MQHLACIMDGNRRYALKHGFKPWIGHQKGVDAVRVALDFCVQRNIPYLSLYTFSIENFRRSEQEKQFLFELISAMAEKHLDELLEKRIKVKFIGDRSLFPVHVTPTLEKIEHKTQYGDKLQVNFLFCYGSQQEIAYAAKEIARKVKAGELQEQEIDEKLIAEYLWTRGMPEPDLIFRTGGQQRLSNYLLFQAAYSEYYFTDQLWPALTTQDLERACSSFNIVKRNFGQ
jgi:undecaprenyl diphosphate synthase